MCLFFKQKTAYELRSSDWSSDVCSSDLLSQSPSCAKLYAAPGNPGIEAYAECVGVAADDIAGLLAFVKAHAIDFVVVGPEAPLVAGLADRLREIGIPVFGPSADAARPQGSKGFTKALCARASIPTPPAVQQAKRRAWNECA